MVKLRVMSGRCLSNSRTKCGHDVHCVEDRGLLFSVISTMAGVRYQNAYASYRFRYACPGSQMVQEIVCIRRSV